MRLWLEDRRVRRIAIGLAIALAALFVRCRWDALTDAQTPRKTFDSEVYLEIAAQPLGFDTVFYPKPPTVPLIYRFLGERPATIASVQAEIAFAAWAILAVALVLALRRWWVRALAIAAASAFLLAAPRVGWSGVVLSESITDSLAAVATALALGLAISPRRRALAIALGVVGVLWLYARDSNAVIVLAAIAAAAVVWPVQRWWRDARWAVAVAGVSAVAAAFLLVTPTVEPEPLPYQASWYPRMASRQAYPVINNILARVMADDGDWLADRGAPIELLAKFASADPATDKFVQAVPELRPAQDWIVDHGQGTYVRWLLRHPLDRIGDLIGARWTVLAAHSTTTMPAGWNAHGSWLGGLTTNRWLLLALLIISPILLRRPRSDPRCGIALCMIASGTIGTAAAYYGDAAEVARHCYGAGQQIVLGLVVALLAFVDRFRHGAPQISVETERTPSATSA